MIRGTYLGLEAARRGLMAAQSALDTVSHNLANANTPGFSRQRVVLKATEALPVPGIMMGTQAGQVGTGVRVESIERIRSQFLDQIFRAESGYQGELDTLKSGLENIEMLFNEPGERGFSNILDSFFKSWEMLSNDPEGTSARANLREVSQTLITSIKNIDAGFDSEIRRINDQIGIKVGEVNALTRQIAALNKEIVNIEGSPSRNANDLRDQRDLLVSQLSKLININVHEDQFGAYSVNVAGHPIVQGIYVTDLQIRTIETATGISYEIGLANKLPLDLQSGELYGLVQLRDKYIPDVRHKFNIAVSSVVNRVNATHREGFGLDGVTNRSFFMDFVTRQISGLNSLPALTGLDTKLFDLGISSGDFFIGDKRIIVTDEDVLPDSTTTVRDILRRVFDATGGRVQGVEGENSTVILELHNPADMEAGGSASAFESRINAKAGTTNFLQLLGLVPESETAVPQDPPYVNIAKAIRLNPLILNDLGTIAAARAGEDGGFSGPGDNRLALDMADLKNYASFVEGDTIFGYYRSTVISLGVQLQETTRAANIQNLVMEQIEMRIESVSGVNLDEEAINMIRYQRSIEASSRMVSALDSVLDRIINNMGLVGR